MGAELLGEEAAHIASADSATTDSWSLISARYVFELHRGDQNLGDQLGFGRGSWVVDVVFDAEVIAHLDFLIGDHLEDAAARLGQIGVRPGQDKTAVLAALEFFIAHTGRQILGFRGE